jgi:hypothetical protein
MPFLSSSMTMTTTTAAVVAVAVVVMVAMMMILTSFPLMPSLVVGKQGSQTALNQVTRDGVESYSL